MRIFTTLIYLTFWLIPLVSFGNSIHEEHYPGKIVFKLTEEAANNKSISLEKINEALKNTSQYAIFRKFPSNAPPAEKFHKSGQNLIDLSLIYELKISEEEDLERIINKLYMTGQVEYAEKYYIPGLFSYTPDDPQVANQYYLFNIQAFDAWAISKGDTSQVIAIVDTGTDLLHPDLINSIKYNYDDPVNGEDSDNDGYIDNFYGWDLGEGDNNPQFNANSHGVLVSGLAAATPDNGTGIAGVGFNSKFLPVKIDNENGRLTMAYEGIIYAADRGASVINLSWGGFMGAGQFGQDIINYAVLNRNAVVIAAAGNSNNQLNVYPAAYKNSLSVAATDIDDIKWSGSSYGISVDLAAPGSAVLTTWPNATYNPGWGTSFASPIVAGAAAVLRSHFPDYDALQIGAQLKVTADNIDTITSNQPYAGLLGTGRLNLYRALTETSHPYLKLVNLENDQEYYQLIQPGESFNLSGYFMNILASAANITAELETSSSHIQILTSEVALGNAPQYTTINNLDSPFVVRIRDSYPASQKADFIVRFYSDGEYAGRETFSLNLNVDYLDIHPNNISTTITSRGTVGYNYPNFNQGIGFHYNQQDRSLVKCAGIIIGNSTAKVVDNIYGATEGSFNQFFVPLINANIIEEPEKSDLEITGKFDDSNAGAFSLNVYVDYVIRTWEASPDNKYMIFEYSVVNTGDEPLSSLYTGFFADWVIKENRQHRAAFNEENKLGYAFSESGGDYTGISLLSDFNAIHYAFDNQGYGGSLKISDGFTSFEKYTALKSNRNSAGLYDPDNDISTLISSGPFYLAPNDTLNIAFALLAGDHISDIINSAENARIKYSSLINDYDDDNGDDDDDDDDVNSISDVNSKKDDIVFIPGNNPIETHLNFSIDVIFNTVVNISLLDLSGKVVLDYGNVLLNTGKHSFTINTFSINPGAYFLQLKTGQSVKTIKVIKI